MTSEDSVVQLNRTNKLLRFCAIVAFFTVLFLNIILVLRLLPEKYENALGDFPSPVSLNRVQGYSGSTVKLGDITVLQQERCVNRDTKLIINTIWTAETYGVPSAPNREQIKMNALKGCSTITMALAMPERVATGKYFIQGIVQDQPTGDVKYWTSEIIVVVP